MNPLSALVGRHIESGAREAVTSGPIPGLLRLGARGYGAMSGMHPLDRGALATAPVPVLGDAVGLAADARMFAQEPESRNPLNFGLAALGALPFVPAMSVRKLYHASRSPKIEGDFRVKNKSVNSSTFADLETERHGVFFSDNPEVATEYGPYLGEYSVDLKNTAEITEDLKYDFVSTLDPFEERELWLLAKHSREPWTLFEGGVGERFVEFLKKRGYDSARFSEEVAKGDDYVEGMTTVVLDPKLISSAKR